MYTPLYYHELNTFLNHLVNQISTQIFKNGTHNTYIFNLIYFLITSSFINLFYFILFTF